MYQMNSEEAQALLRKQGFATREIDRLNRLRRMFAKRNELDEAVPDSRHLEFARWLVEHGKLTDHTT